MNKFAGAYKGHRCFLAGNGPSLNVTPMDALEHEYTFGMNQINLLYDKTIWRPTFYLATTIKGWYWSETWRKNMNENILKWGLTSFVSRTIPIRGINVHPLNVTYWAEHEGTKARVFSENCAFQVGHLGTTMYIAFQLAAWMGFNPIYLVGCDLGYKAEDGESRGHFRDDYWGDRGNRQPMTPEQCDEINMLTKRAHEFSKRYMDSHDIDVFNATVGGELEIWPRRDILEVLS